MWKNEIASTLWNLAAWLGAFLLCLIVALALLVLCLQVAAALMRLAGATLRREAAQLRTRPSVPLPDYSFSRRVVSEHSNCPMLRAVLFYGDRR